MDADRTRQVLASVLSELEANEIPLHKVVIQKFTYFLEFTGQNPPFRFRPFTYGPFSFELSEVLDQMTFWDYIKCDGHTYHIVNIDDILPTDDDPVAVSIKKSVDEFKSIAEGSYSFDSMEVLGTTMYCMKVLTSLGENITEEAVVRDFQGWKGTKYSEGRIKEAFHKLGYFSKN